MIGHVWPLVSLTAIAVLVALLVAALAPRVGVTIAGLLLIAIGGMIAWPLGQTATPGAAEKTVVLLQALLAALHALSGVGLVAAAALATSRPAPTGSSAPSVASEPVSPETARKIMAAFVAGVVAIALFSWWSQAPSLSTVRDGPTLAAHMRGWPGMVGEPRHVPPGRLLFTAENARERDRIMARACEIARVNLTPTAGLLFFEGSLADGGPSTSRSC